LKAKDKGKKVKSNLSQDEVLNNETKDIVRIFGACVFLVFFVYAICKVIALMQ
jgi:hypothetical protein